MYRWLNSGSRAVALRIGGAAALAGIAALGGTVSALAAPVHVALPLQNPDSDVPTNPNDPRCMAMPTVAQCQGGPYAPPTPTVPAPPTGPLDPNCMMNPADAACVGSPYLPPTPVAAPPVAPPPVVTPPVSPPPEMAPPVMAPPPMAPPSIPSPSMGGASTGMPGSI